jgi:hypothetical protein
MNLFVSILIAWAVVLVVFFFTWGRFLNAGRGMTKAEQEEYDALDREEQHRHFNGKSKH